MFWKTVAIAFFVLGVLTVVAGVVLLKRHSLDLWLSDKYFVLSPVHFFLLGAILLIITFCLWKFRTVHWPQSSIQRSTGLPGRLVLTALAET